MTLRSRSVAIVLAVLAACLTSALPASAVPEPVRSSPAIDGFVDEYLGTHHLPGATVAVVREGEVVHEEGYGETSAGDALSEDSLMQIESVSKPFTAFAVLQLVEDGQVGLDDPVVEHLPEFAVDGEGGADVTVRQLLSHTSGLVTPTIIPPADTLAEGVARTSDWSLAAEPGSSYRYSNANYWIAARLVEVVSEQPFGDYLEEHIFVPAGMTDSVNLTTTTTPVRGLEQGHVTSYGLALPAPEVAAMTSGAGGIVSTASDMARWLTVQQNDGRAAGGQQLLAAELIAESHHVQPHAKRSGLGWMRSIQGDPPLIQYSGVGTAYNAQVLLDPGTGNGVVVLLNSFTPTREHAYEIASGILDIADGGQPDVGPRAPMWIDFGLAAVTLLVLLGGVRGVCRAARWAARRRHWRGWRLGLRLLPQLIAPAAAVFLFLVAPTLQNNSFTPVDVFWLYPALMVLLAVTAAVGIVLTAARVRHRLRGPNTPTQ